MTSIKRGQCQVVEVIWIRRPLVVVALAQLKASCFKFRALHRLANGVVQLNRLLGCEEVVTEDRKEACAHGADLIGFESWM